MDTLLTARFVHLLGRAIDFYPRGELNQLMSWWGNGGTGVCCLIGMGGAGKTALVSQFIRLMPGILPADEWVAKETTLQSPRGLFVFSFYESPKVETFFSQLVSWLAGAPPASGSAPSYDLVSYQLERMRPSSPFHRPLIVVDGLERIQRYDEYSAMGEIEDRDFSDLIARIAEGYTFGVRMIAATRLPIAHLHEAPPIHYHPIIVDKLPRSSAVSLLKSRNLAATDAELEDIAERCGYHALTLDIAAGMMSVLAKGSPAVGLGLPTDREIELELGPALEMKPRHIRKQEIRLARIAGHYRELLSGADPMILTVLDHICLSYGGISAEDLSKVIEKQNEQRDSEAIQKLKALVARYRDTRSISADDDAFCQKELGCSAAELVRHYEANEHELHKDAGVEDRLRPFMSASGRFFKSSSYVFATVERAVQKLLQLRLIQPAHGNRLIAHVAVKNSFVGGIPLNLARSVHESARAVLHMGIPEPAELTYLTLTSETPSYVATADECDRIEELIFHTLQVGGLKEVERYYSVLIGGFNRLGREPSLARRGKRICQAIIAASSNDNDVAPIIHYDLAQYNEILEPPVTAIQSYHALVDRRFLAERHPLAGKAARRMAELHLQTGELRAALNMVEVAQRIIAGVSAFFITNDDRCNIDSDEENRLSCLRAYIEMLMLGKPPDFLSDLERLNTVSDRNHLHDVLLLLAAGRSDYAEVICARALRSVGSGTGMTLLDYCSWLVLHGRALISLGRYDEAASKLAEAGTIASDRNHRFLFCLVKSSIAQLHVKIFHQVVSVGTEEGRRSLKMACSAVEEGLYWSARYGYRTLQVDLLNQYAEVLNLSGNHVAAFRYGLRAVYGDAVPAHYAEASIGRAPLEVDTSGWVFQQLNVMASPLISSEGAVRLGYFGGAQEGRAILIRSILLYLARCLNLKTIDLHARGILPAEYTAEYLAAEKEILDFDHANAGQPVYPKVLAMVGDVTKADRRDTKDWDVTAPDVHSGPEIILKKTASSSRSANGGQAGGKTTRQELPVVFISYSRDDEEWRDWVITHLSVLDRQGRIDIWSDQKIVAGSNWIEDIEAAINRARFAILIVSAAFLKSEFVLGYEVPKILSRRQNEGLRLYPIIAKPCAWKAVPWLAQLQCRPRNGSALSTYPHSDIDQLLAEVAEEILLELGPILSPDSGSR